MLLAALALISCGQLTDRESTTSSDPLIIGVPEGTTGQPDAGVEQLANEIVLEGLTQVGIDGRAMPRLAQEWSWEADDRDRADRRLRIKLRNDVYLHDGRHFDAQLAAEALAVALASGGNRAGYPALTLITAARPTGEFELVLDLSDSASLIPEDLTVPLDIPVGPYREVNRAGNTIEFERFDRYYLGRPSISHVTLRPFDTLRTTWASLLRGELDMVYDVPADAIDFIRNDDVQVISVPRWYQFVVAFNSGRSPFQSRLVRQALNLAVNRQALIDNVLEGGGLPSAGPIWPRNWAYDKSIPPVPFDPAQAAALLDAAGFPLPDTRGDSPVAPARLRFVCLIPENFSVWERIALYVQRDLFNVGVDMQFKVVPFLEYNQLIAAGQFDAALIDLISGPTAERPYIFWRSAAKFKGAFNIFGYENVAAERAFNVLLSSTNEAAARSATSRLQRVMIDDPPALFLAWNERARALRRDIVIPNRAGQDPMWTLWSWSRAPLGGASTE